MVLLAVEAENGAVLNYRLAKEHVTVGSSTKNDVVVRGPAIAERHLVIRWNGSVFTFVTVDRQSVVLNGERRSRGILYPGDRVRIGPTTLVFRGMERAAEQGETRPPAGAPASASGRRLVFLSDPAGFVASRAALAAAVASPYGDLGRVVALIKEALPAADVAIVTIGAAGPMTALASVWTGEIPRLSREELDELRAPGRYAQVSDEHGTAVAIPVVAADGAVTAAIMARPAGALGSEGVSLVGEAARLLGLHWRVLGREDAAGPGLGASGRQAVAAAIPGTSQAVQVLRTGLLAATVGREPVLICGGEGVGRREAARLLGSLAPTPGPVALVDGGDVPGSDELRRRLFGPAGLPTLGDATAGAVAEARGGSLILANADRLPLAVQAELAGLISAQLRDPSAAAAPRWVATCGEDPLALVQQGQIDPAFFLVFSRRMLRVPRLAERREDLPLLIAAMMARIAEMQGKKLRGITLECLSALLARPFPGEMAELAGVVNRLVTAAPDGEMVRCEDLGETGTAVERGGEAAATLAEVLGSDNLKQIVPSVERLIIERVMRRVKGNQSKGARALGISRGALIAKLKEYEVSDYRYLRRQQRQR